MKTAPQATICGKRRVWWMVGAVGVTGIVLAAIHVRLYPYALDDAYIHFRIAANLAKHGVPYFNLLEPVKGSSSSAWIILLAALARASNEIRLPFETSLLNAFATLAGAIVYTVLLRRAAKSISPFVAWAFAAVYIAALLPASLALMETPLAMLVVGIALLLLVAGSYWAYALLGVAIAIRPELVAVFGLGVFLGLWGGVRSVPRMLLYGAVGFLPLALFDLHYYGTLIPHSIIAKAIVYDLSYTEAAAQVLGNFVPAIPGMGDGVRLALGVLGFVGIIALSLLALRPALSAGNPGSPRTIADGIPLLMMAWGVGSVAGYILGRAEIFPWYVPLFVVPIAFAGFALLGRATAFVAGQPALAMVFLAVFGLQLCTLGLAAAGAFASPRYYPLFAEGARARYYVQVGSAIQKAFPDTTLMSSEIGGLGWGFGGYIYDGAGLVSPGALKYHPLRVPEQRGSDDIGAIPADLIRDTNPRVIVSYDIFVENFLMSDVLDRYIRIKCPLFRQDDLSLYNRPTFWSSRYLDIFIRKDIIPVDHPSRYLGLCK